MDDHLAKPIEAAELVRVLVDLVEAAGPPPGEPASAQARAAARRRK